MSNIGNFGELTDEAEGASDRVAESVYNALSVIEKGNVHIAVLEQNCHCKK
jgi:hypothetical protein